MSGFPWAVVGFLCGLVPSLLFFALWRDQKSKDRQVVVHIMNALRDMFPALKSTAARIIWLGQKLEGFTPDKALDVEQKRILRNFQSARQDWAKQVTVFQWSAGAVLHLGDDVPLLFNFRALEEEVIRAVERVTPLLERQSKS